LLPNTALVAVLIMAGLFSLTGAILNWEWYYEFRKAKSLVNLFGRDGTRIIYLALGLFLVGGGIIFALNTNVLFLASVK
jgi:hypothetical protein